MPALAVAAPRRRPQEPLRPPPILGMRDSRDPSTADPRKARELRNCYVEDPTRGNSVKGRPGWRRMDQLPPPAQMSYQFSKLDGSEFTVDISGGRFFVYDWTTDTHTEVLTAADLASAGVSIAATGRVYAVTLADQMIVSDGVSSPWMWDGTSGGGVTNLPACPPLFGEPTVHFAKLFGIVAADPITIVWSEENDPTTGYDSGGLNNAWTLGQTDQERLFGIKGTNVSLFYWRARSIGAIAGSVTPNFRTTGTQEGVSLTVGTSSPASIVQFEQSFYFVDSDGRPQRLDIGAGVREPPIWYDCLETVRNMSRAFIGSVTGTYDPDTNLVLFGMAPFAAAENDAILTFHASSGNFAAVWDGVLPHVLATVKDATLRPTIVHGTQAGEFRAHGHPDGNVWDNGPTPMRHVVDGPLLANDEAREMDFTRADLVFDSETELTNVEFDYRTPRGRSQSLFFDVAVGAGFALWDVAFWDVDVWSTETFDWHVAVGLEGMGRWIRPRVQHDWPGERFGWLDWGIDATYAGKKPTAG